MFNKEVSMLNIQKLQEIIVRYKKDFTQHWKNEKYKWVAIKHFQDNWDINAPDFYAMFEKATAKTHNLLASNMFFARGMMLEFIKLEPKTTREMFKKLFDEEQPLAQRITDFIYSSDILKAKNPKWKNHYQNATSISTYLWLMYPDKYYICKYSECKSVIDLFDVDIDFKKGNASSNILSCIDLYNKICDELSKDKEMVELLHSLLTSDCYPDPLFRTLTMDFCFRCSRDYDVKLAQPDIISNDEEGDVLSNNDKHYWLYSPGKNAQYWNEFYSEGIMAIGWNDVGDLSKYDTKDSLAQEIQKIYNKKQYPRNDANTLWSFQYEMKPGDIVFVKKGLSEIVGRGVVQSDYLYDANRNHEYKRIRKVLWTHKGLWQHPGQAVLKTLTDITQYSDYVNELENLITGSFVTPKSDVSSIHYWWLNANPKIWQFNNIAIGEEQTYTLYNDSHNKRRIFQNFLDAKPGDIIVCYESTPVKQIVALGVVSKEHDDKNFYFKKTEQLAVPIDYQDLLHLPELENMEYLKNAQGSLFSLTPEEYNVLIDIIRDSNPVNSEKEVYPPYNEKDFLSEVFMTENDLKTLKGLLSRKKNLILQGAPGVGKTFSAKRLAYSILGRKDETHIEKIQFHSNYSYEDFIMGYKPQENGFKLEYGVFYQFCKKAANNPKEPYFFIIDEINRGNMSKIFGELLMLIEKDYRGPDNSILMAYNKTSFNVPDNLYIIGMMNTADRSLAMIDYALRRRFCFYTIKPGFDTEGFKKYQKSLKNPLFDNVIEKVKDLNAEIAADTSLGKGFCIGHSYFCSKDEDYTPDILYSIVFYEIIPMLEEYWFDDPQKLEKWKGIFKDIFK